MCPKFFGFYFIPQWGCDYKTVHSQLAYVLCSEQPIVQMSWPECRALSSAKQILFKNLNTRKNTQNSDGIWILETSVHQAGPNMINFITHEFFYTNYEGKFWFLNLTSVKCIIMNNWSVPFQFFSEKLKINRLRGLQLLFGIIRNLRYKCKSSSLCVIIWVFWGARKLLPQGLKMGLAHPFRAC